MKTFFMEQFCGAIILLKKSGRCHYTRSCDASKFVINSSDSFVLQGSKLQSQGILWLLLFPCHCNGDVNPVTNQDVHEDKESVQCSASVD